MKQGFTLIEALVVLAVVAVIAVITFGGFLGGAHQADVSSTAQQIVASAREAQSNSASQFKGMTWGIHFENATNTAPFYAVFTGNSYAAGTVESTYRLPADVAFVSSTLAPGTKIDVTFNPVSGIPSASTTIRIYAIATPSISSTIYIAGVGEISLGTTAYTAPVSPSQNLWVSDTNNDEIYEYNMGGGLLAQFSAYYGATSSPDFLAVDATGNVWVTDSNNYVLDEFSATGTHLAQVGTSSSGTVVFGGGPSGIAIDGNDDMWIADNGNSRVLELSPTGTELSTFGSYGSGNGNLNSPTGIALDVLGNVWVADSGNNRVEGFSATGTYLSHFSSFGSSTSTNGCGFISSINDPFGLAIDSSGNSWVADQGNDQMDLFSATGTYAMGAGNCNPAPKGAAIDNKGDIWYVGNSWNAQHQPYSPTIVELSPTGALISTISLPSSSVLSGIAIGG